MIYSDDQLSNDICLFNAMSSSPVSKSRKRYLTTNLTVFLVSAFLGVMTPLQITSAMELSESHEQQLIKSIPSDAWVRILNKLLPKYILNVASSTKYFYQSVCEYLIHMSKETKICPIIQDKHLISHILHHLEESNWLNSIDIKANPQAALNLFALLGKNEQKSKYKIEFISLYHLLQSQGNQNLIKEYEEIYIAFNQDVFKSKAQEHHIGKGSTSAHTSSGEHSSASGGRKHYGLESGE